jgi:hypothetical protein
MISPEMLQEMEKMVPADPMNVWVRFASLVRRLFPFWRKDRLQ